ncbi:MAG: nucleotidyltransferase family protein [Gemmatimonadales bacterium]
MVSAPRGGRRAGAQPGRKAVSGTLDSLTRKELARLTVPLGASILDALKALDRGARGIVLVRDRRGRVLGTLTDGDVRRAVLAGASLDSRTLESAMHRGFAFVDEAAGRPEVLDLMRARNISQVPVLDGGGRLVGLHLLREFLGSRPRPNCALLLAGGRGERLRPLTDHTPKPMIQVAGRPILERLVLHLVGAGIRRLFISLGHLGHVIERHFGDGSRFGCEIEYLRETRPLGTGGPLSLLPALPDVPLLVLNGDLVTQADVARLIDFHVKGRYVATMGVRTFGMDIPFGVVEVKAGRLTGLQEKPREQVLVNSGIYVLSRSAVRMVPAGEDYPITRLFETCLQRRLRVGACMIEEEWIDVGRHDQLRAARGQL